MNKIGTSTHAAVNKLFEPDSSYFKHQYSRHSQQAIWTW